MFELNKIEKLKSLTLHERLTEIENDIISNSDEYKKIKPNDLAQLLEVPLDAINGENPDDWYKWATWKYVEILSIDKLINRGHEMEELLDYLENENRIELLLNHKDDHKIIFELTEDEKNIISLALAENELNALDGDRHFLVAQFCVNPESETRLFFEATLNGDYRTMDSLKTPYQERDGEFLDIDSNEKYLSVFINEE